MSKWFDAAKGLKVKDLAPYAKKYAQENLTYSVLSTRSKNFLADYKTKYIDTGSSKPITDIMVGVFFLSYAIAYPTELRHLKAEQAAKLAGESAAH